MQSPDGHVPMNMPSLTLGFLAGVAAGLAASLVALAIRAVAGIPSPPESMADPATLVMPPELFALTLSLLGFLAKPLLVVALLTLQILLAGAVGTAYVLFRRTIPGIVGLLRDAAMLTLAASTGAWLAFLPLVGKGLFGADDPAGAGSHVIAALLTNGVYSLVLVLNLRSMTYEVDAGERAGSIASPSRRRLLAQLGVGAIAIIAGGGILLQRSLRSFGNSVLEPIKGMPSEVTSNDRFYVVSKNIYSPMLDPTRLADPVLEAGDWRLEVKGLVESPLTLSYEQLRALPAVEQHYTLCCISNPIGGGLIGNALWKGVPLKAVLDLAGVKPGVRKVVLRCADKYSESITWEKANRESNLIAWEMNGESLPIEHGFPARLLIPNLYGIKNVKWVTEIEPIDDEFQGYWQLRGWTDEAVIQTMSRINVPNQFTKLTVGDIEAGGIAFAGSRGIARVEISSDEGETWHTATVKQALSPYSWVLWTADWSPPASGSHELRVRATDGTGQVQTDERTRTLPDGATGHHTIVVKVAEPDGGA